MKHIIQKSRGVVFVAAFFLLLLVLQLILFNHFFAELKEDNQVISDLSRIRGSIQRYAKLELAGVTVEGLTIEAYLDSAIAFQLSLPQSDQLNHASQYYDKTTLKLKWDELKLLVHNYRNDPSKENSLAVISKSEECWEVSNTHVMRNQYVLNKTTEFYRYFTVTFALNLLAVIFVLYLYKRLIHNVLTISAINDPLTEIFNKGYFNDFLENELERAARKHYPFSLIMFDIDRFKLVNDTYGHRRGDYALRALSDLVRNTKRNMDVLARIGGEEFIILLPDTGISEASRMAERIRSKVEEFSFEEIGKITISLGVTQFREGDTNERIMKRVDTALYKAKENGRNRIEIIHEGSSDI